MGTCWIAIRMPIHIIHLNLKISHPAIVLYWVWWSMHLHLQGTLALIKPDAFQRRIEIEEIILKEGGINQWQSPSPNSLLRVPTGWQEAFEIHPRACWGVLSRARGQAILQVGQQSEKQILEKIVQLKIGLHSSYHVEIYVKTAYMLMNTRQASG